MPVKAIHQFPRGFLWGCATAAYQVEGQNANDWWRWEQKPGKIFQNQKVGRACDWWSGRYIEDFDRAADLNNNAQRISIEWSRVEPEPGKWDEWAIERYRDMVKALLARGMTPMITLHHFTNPLWIADHDSWVWDETPVYFERYVRKIVSALKDLCWLWCTINEPMGHVMYSYQYGNWPPGLHNNAATWMATVNLVRGHAMAYHAIKEIQPESQVGFANAYIGANASHPAIINWPAVYGFDRIFNRVFIDVMRDGIVRPLLYGRVNIPQAKGALDWIGMQYYTEFDFGFSLFQPRTLFVEARKPKGMPAGPELWGGFDPDRLQRHIRWMYKMLNKPIYLTESGVPDPDDSFRPSYLVRTVRSMWTTVNNNIPVRGFFFWSLLDNFEWSEGYDPRFNFGLYKVNFETQERTARPSAELYTQICRQNGLAAATIERFTPELLSSFYPGEPGKNNVNLKTEKKPATT